MSTVLTPTFFSLLFFSCRYLYSIISTNKRGNLDLPQYEADKHRSHVDNTLACDGVLLHLAHWILGTLQAIGVGGRPYCVEGEDWRP